MEKGRKNADLVAHKLGSVLTKVTNQRLGIIREKKQKKEEMMERQKIEAITAKH